MAAEAAFGMPAAICGWAAPITASKSTSSRIRAKRYPRPKAVYVASRFSASKPINRH
jgi:hypothetical protein